MDIGKKSNDEIVFISIDTYDYMYSEWVLKIFGKAMDDYRLMGKFDLSMGLELINDDHEIDDGDTYSFAIKDKRKLMVAKLKYGF
jgi:hypothetical protein